MEIAGEIKDTSNSTYNTKEPSNRTVSGGPGIAPGLPQHLSHFTYTEYAQYILYENVPGI